MMRLIVFCGFVLLNLAIRAQVTPVPQDLAALVARYEKFEFKGHFALVVEADSVNNIILVDLAVFPSRFERVFFMDQSFTCKELVNIDPDITRSRIFFMSGKTHDARELLRQLDKIRDDVLKKASSMSLDEKTAWLKSNDKYK